jgi:hypothetical protein
MSSKRYTVEFRAPSAVPSKGGSGRCASTNLTYKILYRHDRAPPFSSLGCSDISFGAHPKERTSTP